MRSLSFGSGPTDLLLPALRCLPAEFAHDMAMAGMARGFGPRVAVPPGLGVTLAGLSLPSPIGLAAGLDKNARAPDAFLAAGFGFVECGTVTPQPQMGNPKPRLFRLSEDQGIINRLGFNNDGLDAFATRLEARRARKATGIIGANLGANKSTEDKAADYVLGLKRLWGLPSYFTINISSPNTPGLRLLQSPDALRDLLSRIANCRAQAPLLPSPTPIFLKIAPDLAEDDLPILIATVQEFGIDGLIVSNTTLKRPESLQSPRKDETGGLSGRPVFETSTAMLRLCAEIAGGKLPLIAAGGIDSPETMQAKFAAGASAVQVYSGLIYKGFGLVKRLTDAYAATMASSA